MASTLISGDVLAMKEHENNLGYIESNQHQVRKDI